MSSKNKRGQNEKSEKKTCFAILKTYSIYCYFLARPLALDSKMICKA